VKADLRILRNTERVFERIERAAERSGRKPEDIRVVAVTKEASLDEIEVLLGTGRVKEVGENRVQQLVKRIDFFKEKRLTVHFIGRLQTNKVKKIIGEVDLIQSADRLNLAEEISKRASSRSIVQDVLVEVNVSGEESKAGVRSQELAQLIEKILDLPSINIRGIMTMAPFVAAEDTRPFFRQAFELFDKLKEMLGKDDFDILSMGMSNDFEVAIEEGSNIVRIGTAFFE
jgi:hypothetical protein